jgi:hypothetical protein
MYKDSVGNSYSRLPPKKENPSAKSTKANSAGRKGRSQRRPKVGNGGCGCEFCRNYWR